MYVRRRGLGASPLAITLSSAISRQENTNPSYNNPCGLVKGAGQTGTASNGIAIFGDSDTGLTDCQNLIDNYIGQGATINSLINAWAPAPSAACGAMCTGNNPSAYASNVATWTGIDPTVPLNSLSSSVGTGAGSSWDIGTSDASVFDVSSVDWSTVLPIVAIGGLFLLLVSEL